MTTNGQPPSESSVTLPPSGSQSFEKFSELLRANMPAQGDSADDDAADDGESHAGGEDGGDAEPKPRKSTKPKSLKHAAEMLGITEADLYALEIPSSRQGEKPYTLGKLKDLAASEDDHTVRTLRLDADRRTFERERVTAETELREMLEVLPEESLKPEALKKLRANIEQKHARERGEILRVIPEWSDEKVRLEDLRGMVEHLKGYGLPETALMERFDHRIMRFVRDAWRVQTAVNKALAQVKERRGKTPPKAQAGGESRQRRDSTPPPGGGDQRNARQVRGFLETIAAAAAQRRST